MIKRLCTTFSSLLLRGHHYLNRRPAEMSRIPPRKLQYTPYAGKPLIFHFNGNFVVGGTSQLIADIVERTSDTFTHRVFVPNHPQPLPYQPLPVHAFPLSNMQGLFDYLSKERPALVHIHYWIRSMHRYYDFGLWYKTVFLICGELGLKVVQNIDVPTAPFKNKDGCL